MTIAESTIDPMREGRVGGHLVAESLHALGADVAIGLPGQHALGTFDGLLAAGLRFVGFRTEVGASFAAHGYATASNRPAPLLLSTGPGALMSLAGLQEAETTGTPVVCIVPEIPREGLRRNRGFVHELRDQAAHFSPLVKFTHSVTSDETLPDVLAAAWREALTPPSGPVFVQIPVDILSGATRVPPVTQLDGAPDRRPPRAEALDHVAALLRDAETVTIVAGGGVVRAGAEAELKQLAEQLGAPVVTTYGGKGVLSPAHPLYAGSACEDAATMSLIGDADVALVVGSSLSEETSNHYSLRFRGRAVQIDADPSRVATTYPTVAVIADAKLSLVGLRERLGDRAPNPAAAARAAAVRSAVEDHLKRQGRQLERGILRSIERALPAGGLTAWDMTIMAYWATMDFACEGSRRFVYPQGSGTLGYGYPAGLGAQIARPDAPVLAVAGDGGIMYGLGELATARQNGIATKLLVIDDGGYGVLREYQRDAFGRTHATDLACPDFAAVFEAFGVAQRSCTPDELEATLTWAFATEGPAAIVMQAQPEMFAATHHDG